MFITLRLFKDKTKVKINTNHIVMAYPGENNKGTHIHLINASDIKVKESIKDIFNPNKKAK